MCERSPEEAFVSNRIVAGEAISKKPLFVALCGYEREVRVHHPPLLIFRGVIFVLCT